MRGLKGVRLYRLKSETRNDPGQQECDEKISPAEAQGAMSLIAANSVIPREGNGRAGIHGQRTSVLSHKR